MIELVTEILIYLGIAALLGLVLGYLIWGWGMRGRINAARAEGAASARTTVDGDTAMRERLEACMAERKRLDAEVARLTKDLEDKASETAEAPEPEERANAEDAGPDSDANDAAPEEEPENEPDVEPETEPETEPEPDVEVTEETTTKEPEEPEVAPSNGAPEDGAEPVPEPPAPPKLLLSERPDEVDDLKEIKGVGKVMEGVLNDKGLYLFRQVANLTPQDVAWVNEAIDAFPGRIERDAWVAQAQTLYREKYGRAHDAPED